MGIVALWLAAMQPAVVQAPPPNVAAVAATTLRLRLADRASRAAIAYEAPRNNVLFRATINGRPATVLLDNGAARTLVDRTFATRVGVGVRPSDLRAVTGALTRLETWATDPIVIEAAGTFRVEGPLVAVDLRPVATALGRPVDAVLGGDVLEHFAVTIDPGSRRLSFHQGGSAKADSGTVVLPIGTESNVSATLGGQTLALKIDLGFSGVVRLTDAAWRRVVASSSPTRAGSQKAADGVVRATRRADAPMVLGPVRLARVTVDSGYVPAGAADGLLGNGFLARGPIVLDLKGRQLLLLPRQPAQDRCRDQEPRSAKDAT